MDKKQFYHWLHHFDASLDFQPQILIMGILNITEDSFSDGGKFLDLHKAIDHANDILKQGADIIDIGGESTRPGAQQISCDQELDRVIPVIEKISANTNICISIDTYRAKVMEEAVHAGAGLINDIKALREPEALETAAQLKVPVCLMHMKGEPNTMQESPHYNKGIMREINEFLEQRINACLQAGLLKSNLILDPGFGYGKTIQHNLSMVRQITEFKKQRLPLLLGVSRKSTIGAILNEDVLSRLPGSLAVTAYAILNGVSIIRTHDVKETRQVVTMIDAIMRRERE